MNKIKGEELRDFLDSESKKIAILDNNSANFFYTISNKANVDELLKKYDYPPNKSEKAIEDVMEQVKLQCVAGM